MLSVIYGAIAVFFVLLVVSLWLTSKNKLFANQIRSRAERAVVLELLAQNEPNEKRANRYLSESVRLKQQVAKLLNSSQGKRFREDLVLPLNNNRVDLNQLSLGQLMHHYGRDD